MTMVGDRWTTVTTEDGGVVHVLVHEPGIPARGQLVWAHGGSWQHGSAAQWAPMTRRLAACSGWAVTSVDYRLADAARFPAAVCDVLDVLGHVDDVEMPLAVGGDSAGGTIAALVALARRDRGERVPSQFLAYPPLDPGCGRPSYHRDPTVFPRPAELRRAWRVWLDGDGGVARGELRRSPLDAASLSGLAPAFLAVGDLDPVLDDVVEYAGLLCAADVPTSLSIVPGATHADLLGSHSGLFADLTAALIEAAAEGSTTIAHDERTAP
ncbi:alpha/beta hydrolase fold domain-containing protein [Isoptericola halotolerans]|uniref:alpha/beta hydrolase fold domain-containing protein n=1 Tax=Isoptericola halotolerans TaxID=300560 RepID=UPI00388E57F7